MSSFTIQQEGQPTRVYRLAVERVTVGRAEEAELVLPDTSVSRRHATITRTTEGVEVMDTGSANGTLVNGKEVVRWVLTDGDVVQIGTFLLTYRDTDDAQDIPEVSGFWGNDEITSIGVPDLDVGAPALADPLAEPTPPPMASPEVATVDRRRSARFESVENPAESWPIGEGTRLGKDGVPVRGVLPIVTPPAVTWNGTAHVIRRESILVPMDVNGRSAREHTLQPGDEVRVGTTRIRYVLA
jgi:FHA domain